MNSETSTTNTAREKRQLPKSREESQSIRARQIITGRCRSERVRGIQCMDASLRYASFSMTGCGHSEAGEQHAAQEKAACCFLIIVKML